MNHLAVVEAGTLGPVAQVVLVRSEAGGDARVARGVADCLAGLADVPVQ